MPLRQKDTKRKLATGFTDFTVFLNAKDAKRKFATEVTEDTEGTKDWNFQHRTLDARRTTVRLCSTYAASLAMQAKLRAKKKRVLVLGGLECFEIIKKSVEKYFTFSQKCFKKSKKVWKSWHVIKEKMTNFATKALRHEEEIIATEEEEKEEYLITDYTDFIDYSL